MRAFGQNCLEILLLIVKNRSIFLTLVLSVYLYSFFYPAAYQAQHAEHVPIVIVDQEQSPLTQKIIQTAKHSPSIEVVAITEQYGDAFKLVQTNQAEGILYLPNNLSTSIHHGDSGGIGIYLSAAYFLRTQQAGLGLADSLQALLSQELEKFTQIHHKIPHAPVHKIPLFNPLSGYGSYVFAAVAPLIVHQTLLLGVGMMITQIRQQQRRLSLHRLFAIFAVVGVIGVLSCFYLFGFAFWWHDYPRGGNFIGMVLTSVLFVYGVIALALFMASFFDMPERVGQVLIFSSVPLFLLSGVVYPLAAMPPILAWFARLLPSTQGILAFVQFNQMGVTIADVLPKLVYLAITMLIFTMLAIWRLCFCSNHPTRYKR
ncbi:ABC transporter permease [Moraxella sp. ZJ142]|uniref:ABC transporter permease n=1 Tax=Moraxella marmotae TaxID=3344520 RepID=UPI0035D47E44